MTKFNFDIILYGGPGSGKGTQAQLLIKKLAAYHLDMGLEIRRLATKRSTRARQVKALMEAGRLIPIAITKSIAKDYLKLAGRRPIIFDGYPRSPIQARDLDALERMAKREVIMIYLKLPIAVMHKRLAKRAKLGGRTDDQNPTVIRRRIDIFRHQADKLLPYYRIGKRLHVIDGNQSVVAVHRSIRQALQI